MPVNCRCASTRSRASAPGPRRERPTDFDIRFVLAVGDRRRRATVGVGVLVALPAIRTRGVTLAIVTLALALVFSALIFQNASLTGGFEGIRIASPEILGCDLEPFVHPQRYAASMLVVLRAVSLVVANLRIGATGRQMIAVRSNERAAAALGISVVGRQALRVRGRRRHRGARGHPARLPGRRTCSSRLQCVRFAPARAVRRHRRSRMDLRGRRSAPRAAPGAIAEQIVGDLFPSLDNVAAWLAIFSGSA